MSGTTLRDVHIGIVTDNNDEEQRGRIKVASATLCGTDDNGDPLEYPVFINPVYPVLFSSDGEVTDGGWFFIPSVGTRVEIVQAAKSTSDAVPGAISSSTADIRWQACLWPKSDSTSIPSEFLTNYPERRGIKTQRGHFLLFDDTEGDEKVSLECSTEEGYSFLSFDKTGTATMLTAGSHFLCLNDDGNTIDIIHKDSHMMSMHENGVMIVTKNSNMFTIDDSSDSMNIMAQTSITLQSTSVAVNGGLDVYNTDALLASAAVKNGVVPGQEFLTLLNAVLVEIAAIGAANQVGTGPAPIPTPNAIAMQAAIGAGLYESTACKVE